MNIVAVSPADDPILIDHYLAIWDSYGTPADDYAEDARTRMADFIDESRERGCHGGYMAIIDGEIAGSVICCLLRSPYPEVIKSDRRLRGYIWSVYTAPKHRRKGVGRALTERAVSHLRAAGCTSIVLHASDAGAPMYGALGFRPAHEMRIDL
jgi:ribosomal protein S18 acetylase RimI-like enzyme